MENFFKGVSTIALLYIVNIACVGGACTGDYCIADPCWDKANTTFVVPGTTRYDYDLGTDSCTTSTNTNEYKTVSILTESQVAAGLDDITLAEGATSVLFQSGTAKAVTVNDGEMLIGISPISIASVSGGLSTTNFGSAILFGAQEMRNVGGGNSISVAGNSKVTFQIGSTTNLVGDAEITDNGSLVILGGIFLGDGQPGIDWTTDINTVRIGHSFADPEDTSVLTITGALDTRSTSATTCALVDDNGDPVVEVANGYGIVNPSQVCQLEATLFGQSQGGLKIKVDIGTNGIVRFINGQTIPELPSPESIAFVDTNPSSLIGSASDNVEIGRALLEGQIDGYVTRWGKGNGCNIPTDSFIGQQNATGDPIIYQPLVNKTLPDDALELIAYSKSYFPFSQEGTSCVAGTRMPINTAQGLTGFSDTATGIGQISGDTTITKAINESNFNSYKIYFGNTTCDKLVEVANKPKTGADIVHNFANTAVPASITANPFYITVTPYSSSKNIEMACVSVTVFDQ